MSDTLDSALQEIGGFGLFQYFLTFAMFLCSFFCNDASWIDFTDYTQAHMCYVHELSNVSSELYEYIAIPFQKGSKDLTYSQCDMFDYNYSNYSMEDFLNWTRSNSAKTRPCDNGWKYNYSVFKRTVSSDYDLVCDSTWKLDLITSLFVAGGFPGSLISGYLSDRYGRKRIIILLIIFKCVSNVVSVTVSDYYVYAASRFFDGAFYKSVQGLMFILASEWVLPKYRSVITLANVSGVAIGFMASSLVAYFIRNYKYFLLFWTVSNGLFLIPLIFIPESPKWLLVKHRIVKCEKALRTVAKINGTNFTQFLLSDVPDDSASVDKPLQEKDSLLSVWRNRILRNRLIILILNWFTGGLSFYIVLLGVSKLNEDIFLNSFLMASADLFGAILATFLVGLRLFGRKMSLIYCYILLSIVSIMMIFINMYTLGNILILLSTILCRIFLSSMFFIIVLFTTELFPTSVRSLCCGICNVANRIGSMTAPFVGDSLMKYWHPLPTVVVATFCLISAIPIIYLPDTRNSALPDTIEEFHYLAGDDSSQNDESQDSISSTRQLIE